MFEQSNTEMLWQIVFRFAICVCLVGKSAAKCVPEKCGDKEVSYPFWINNFECGYPGFHIRCQEDSKTGMMAAFFRAYLGDSSQEFLPAHDCKIRDIDYQGHLVVDSTNIFASSCNASTPESKYFLTRESRPFTISMSNKFLVVGCNTVGTYRFGKWGNARCVSTCFSQTDPAYCRYGCCEITLPDNWKWFNFTGGVVYTINDTRCGFSTILDPSTFRVVDHETDFFDGTGRKANYGLRLNWGITLQNCSAAKFTVNYSCAANAECIDSPSGEGHVCKCPPGYIGNGYLNGTSCTDINECIETSNNSSNNCVEEEKGGICLNFNGSYGCSCAKGYKGDGLKNGTRCVSERSSKTAMEAAIGSVSAFLGVCLAACGVVWLLRVRYVIHAREEYFRSNGGLMLQRILGEKGKQREGKSFRIFSENELKMASRNYSEEMKLGSGGSSTVYKGILSDETAVAIKKFKDFSIGVESEEAMRQFVNEIDILSGLNHKNVVSLVGCCLETQSPLLVYEYVDGGTISHQLRNGGLSSWQRRLRIAMGSADALAYLHSKSIIHRDVKSSNILLDSRVTPKVADFGISRLLCGDDTHLITNVMGTHGYMDPEYFDTGVLTDRSDVYSFGVFLAELLTGREPISPGKPKQEIVLANYFLLKCKDNSLTDMFDPRVKNEENLKEMSAVANLAKRCLCVEGSERPCMGEVKMKVEEIGGSTATATLTTTVSHSDNLDHQISSGPPTGQMNSLFQLTEMSRFHGR